MAGFYLFSKVFKACLQVFDKTLKLCFLFALGIDNMLGCTGNKVFVCKLTNLRLDGVCIPTRYQ